MSEKIDIQIVNEQPTLSFEDSSVVLSVKDSSSPSLAFTDSSVNLSIGDSIAPSLALNGGATSINLSVGNSSNEIQLVATGTPGPKGADGSGSGGGGLNTEEVQDVVGAMLTGNTETRITVEYKDEDGTIDFVVDDMTADTNTQLPLIDDDTMATASSTNVASAESVKAYVDAQTHLELGTTSTTALAGDTTTISGAQASAITANTAKTGITTGQADAITANTAKPDLTVDGAGTVHANNYTNTTYSEATSSDAGLMSTAHHDKLDNIEPNADVTDNANVTAAGALMDSELTDLAGIKSLNTSNIQLKPSEGGFVNGDKTKLDGIAAGAEVNVNADWNSSSGDSQILNKPTIPVDLTVSGTGTIHASNVPTLNQDTTGNAATATSAGTATNAVSSKGVQGGTGVDVDISSDVDINITSNGEVTVKLDSDNNESNQKFKITDNSDASVFTVDEGGTVGVPGILSVGSRITNNGSDSSLGIDCDGSMVFTIDRDDDEVAKSFSFKDFNSELVNISDRGDMLVNGIITGKQREVYSQSFIDDLGTTIHYLPWKDINEQTTIYQEEAAMLMPCDGRIVSVTVRVASITGSGNMTIAIETIGPNVNQFGSTNWSLSENEVLPVTSSDDYHVFHFAFSNPKHFDSGDLVSISIQNSADLSGTTYWYVSTVVEYDWRTFLGTSSSEYDSNP